MELETKDFWGYISSKGELLPTTIREKKGDSNSALIKSYHHYKVQECKIVRLRIHILTEAQTESSLEK